MYQAVIFDFFDVVHLDYQKAWLKNHGYKREGGFAKASDLLDLGQITFQEYLERYAKLSNRTADEMEREFQALARVDDAVVQLIGKLHQQYQTGLISNAHSEELRPILERHDLTTLFDEIVISSEAGFRKPDPEIFRLMLKLLKVAPTAAIFIDDNPTNVAAAATLGIMGICYESAPQLLKALHERKIQTD